MVLVLNGLIFLDVVKEAVGAMQFLTERNDHQPRPPSSFSVSCSIGFRTLFSVRIFVSWELQRSKRDYENAHIFSKLQNMFVHINQRNMINNCSVHKLNKYFTYILA
jgi:hypothetical protein